MGLSTMCGFLFYLFNVFSLFRPCNFLLDEGYNFFIVFVSALQAEAHKLPKVFQAWRTSLSYLFHCLAKFFQLKEMVMSNSKEKIHRVFYSVEQKLIIFFEKVRVLNKQEYWSKSSLEQHILRFLIVSLFVITFSVF